MFSLNEAITRWKNKTLNYGKCSGEDLEELESHFLEHFEELRDSGLSEEEAFSQAVTRMGAPEDVSREFSKVQTFTKLGAGIAIGVAFGLAIDNVGLGIALGLAIGAAMYSSQKKDSKST